MQALQQRDVVAQVDDRLRVLRTPAWWWLAAAGLLVVAFIGWAALTPSVAAVSGPARVVAATGVIQVQTPQSGVVNDPVAGGAEISDGDALFSVAGSQKSMTVRATTPGTVWQVLGQDGTFVRSEEPVLTMLPPGSGDSALVLVPEEQAEGLAEGQDAVIGDGQSPNAVVVSVGPPLPAQVAAARTALTPDAPGQYVLVGVDLQQDRAAGSEAPARLIVSQVSVLGRILGR